MSLVSDAEVEAANAKADELGYDIWTSPTATRAILEAAAAVRPAAITDEQIAAARQALADHYEDASLDQEALRAALAAARLAPAKDPVKGPVENEKIDGGRAMGGRDE